jgi:hypothetical protein
MLANSLNGEAFVCRTKIEVPFSDRTKVVSFLALKIFLSATINSEDRDFREGEVP